MSLVDGCGGVDWRVYREVEREAERLADLVTVLEDREDQVLNQLRAGQEEVAAAQSRVK